MASPKPSSIPHNEASALPRAPADIADKLTLSSSPSELPFPNELMLDVLQYLAPRELARCRAVCSRLLYLIDDTPRFQYGIELYLAGMVDRDSDGKTLHARLAEIKQLRRSWRRRLPFSSDATVPYSFRNYHVSAGVLGQQVAGNAIKFHKFSPTSEGIRKDEWAIEGLAFPLYDFAMDAAQDLLIAIETILEAGYINSIKVHLLSLHTGHPHPLAQISAFTIEFFVPAWHFKVNATCCGDSLGLVASNAKEDKFELRVWNWKTGSRRLNTYNYPALRRDMAFTSSLHFLDADHVLIPAIESDRATGIPQALIYVFDCRETRPNRTGLVDIAALADKFELPLLAEHVLHVKFRCHDNNSAPPSSGSPFQPDPALRILAFEVELREHLADDDSDVSRWPRYNLFVRAEAFLQRKERYGPTWGAYKWESQWSKDALITPGSTRDDTRIVTSVSLNRCFVVEAHGHPDTPKALIVQLYEFPATGSMQRDLTLREDLGSWTYFMVPEILVNKRYWKQDVKSGLAYRKLDTGIKALSLAFGRTMNDHMLTGSIYLQSSNSCWRVSQLPGPYASAP